MNSLRDIFNAEFNGAVREVQWATRRLSSSQERTNIMQWLSKLWHCPSDRVQDARNRNNYAQYMRIMMTGTTIYFVHPFKAAPSTGDLMPFPEMILNQMRDQCPGLAQIGPIRPILCQTSEDGRSMITVKQCPEGSISCYMACTMGDDVES